MHVNFKQFGLAANVTEQMSQLRARKRKLEQELTLLQQKRKECQRQKTRVCTAKETSAMQTTKLTDFEVRSATTSLKQVVGIEFYCTIAIVFLLKVLPCLNKACMYVCCTYIGREQWSSEEPRRRYGQTS